MLEAQAMSPRKLRPLHPARNHELLHALIESMRTRGWVGRPLLGWETPEGDVRLFTGAHRCAAAKELGLEPPVALVEVPAGILEASDDDLLINGACVMGDDELESLLEDHDPEALPLLRQDRRHAGGR